MMLGDTTQATIQLKWWSPTEEDFDFSPWMDERRQSLWATATEGTGITSADSFDQTLWLPEAQSRKGARTSVWYGYAKQARLIVEVVINDAAGREVLDDAKNLVLPSMDVSGPDTPTRWSVYDTRFESPSGYEIYDSRLSLGAILLLLRRGKDRLMLCQFYPATGALARQPLSDWLEVTALKGKWHSKRKDADIEDCRVGDFAGIRQERVMARPWPLDLLGRSFCLATIVHDTTLDRLLMAEHIHLTQADDRLVTEAIEKMNWI